MNARPSNQCVRVILVGRETPGAGPESVESRLRRDPGIELVRAREPLDAIGELARPMGMEGVRGLAVVALPGAIEARDERDFAAAVVRVSPAALVLGLNGSAGDVATLTPAAIHAMFSGASAPPAPAQTAPAAARARPTPAPAATTSATTKQPALPEHPEAPLIRALLSGSDVLEPCLAEIRGRLGDPSASFVGASDDETPPPAGARCTPVEHRGVRLGTLVTSERVGALSAADAAAWLALWLVLRDQQSQLRHAAFTDPLTGVWNRRYFDRFLHKSIDDARARRHELSLLVFDVDNFKQFNDRHGHAAGDEILIETVRLLRSVVRPNDRVCRIGGDEFAVVFYEPEGPRDPSSRHPSSLADIAERFQRQIAEQRFPKLGAHAPGVLSISGGMATFPWDASDAESLVARADALAMESKALGKNTIKFGVGRPSHPGA